MNIMQRIRCYSICLLLFCFSLPAWSSERPDVRVGYIEFPPMFSTVNGKPEGILLEIGRGIYQQLGLSYSETSFPVKRLFKNLNSGLTDVWYGIKIDSLKEGSLIGTQPIYHIELRAYSLQPGVSVSKKEDLVGKKVILILGYSYSQWGSFIRNPDSGVTYVEVKSHKQALKMLKTGRFDYLLNYRYPVEQALEQQPLDNLFHRTLSKLPVFFYVSRKYPNAEQMLEQLDETFRQLARQGRFQFLTPEVVQALIK